MDNPEEEPAMTRQIWIDLLQCFAILCILFVLTLHRKGHS